MNLDTSGIVIPIAACAACGQSPLSCTCDTAYNPAPIQRAAFKQFDFERLTYDDRRLVERYIGSLSRAPDVVIDSHESGPYIWRWHVVSRTGEAGMYLHIQTTSDPERPLHDHPWDNMSCILAGGYNEIVQMQPPHGDVSIRECRAGDTIFRRAEFAHRLILPPDIPYTISQFSTGRRKREWGFWIDGTWHPHQDCITNDPNTQQVFFKEPTATL